MPRPPLLLHLASVQDPQRLAVGPVLAAAASRAGWTFESYHDDRRRGRHFGGGDPGVLPAGSASGALVAGGGHVEQVLWLTRAYQVVAVGDPEALLWPVLVAAGAEVLRRSHEPAQVYEAVLTRLGQAVPDEVLVVDGAPQGRSGLVVAPYLYPELLDGPPRLAVEVTATAEQVQALVGLGARRFSPLGVERARADAFPVPLEGADDLVGELDYAGLTETLARRHAGWARGFLLGDPGLVAAQLARAHARRLLPLYSQPQTTVIGRAADLLRQVGGTVVGRQYDDHDFFTLAPLGHGLQLVDPGPPFEALRGRAVALPAQRGPVGEPVPDAQLKVWADEGRVLSTLLFWSGMVRELDCVPRVVDLVATTGLHAGLVVTSDAVLHQPRPPLGLVGAAVERGGVGGNLELVLGSLGHSVTVEGLLPPGLLERSLLAARAALSDVLPEHLLPRGWWPILDAPIRPAEARLLRVENGRPVVRVPRAGAAPPAGGAAEGSGEPSLGPSVNLRSRVGRGVARAGLDRFLEGARPYDWQRPGPFHVPVGEAVRAAGLDYMWTKTHFGEAHVAHRSGDFVAVPLTAGVWGGWTPFYTAERTSDLRRAERRLLGSGRPGWLAATVDSPLWLGSGEVLEHGRTVLALAEWLVAGGGSGRLVNVTPSVVARYARLLDDRARSGGAAAG